MKLKPREPICGKLMHASGQQSLDGRVRTALGVQRVACQLDPGHEGNHFAKMKNATYTWSNEEKNPQKI